MENATHADKTWPSRGCWRVGDSKIIDRRKFPYQRTGPDHQRIEVDGKHPNLRNPCFMSSAMAMRAQLLLARSTNLAIRSRRSARQKRRYAVAVGLFCRLCIGPRIARLDLIHEASGRGDACFSGNHRVAFAIGMPLLNTYRIAE